MTNEQLDEIKSHRTDPTANWDILLAQQDRITLLAEVARLRERVSTAPGTSVEVEAPAHDDAGVAALPPSHRNLPE
jgi:hypothetical protein